MDTPCLRCGNTLSKRTAHASYCPECRRQVQIERCRKWRAEHPDLYKQIRRESEAKHREQINAYAREWRRKHGHNGLCPICGRDKKLVYEHCHKTGKHRGYVCRECNSGMGMFGDDPIRVRRAADYLDAHSRPQ